MIALVVSVIAILVVGIGLRLQDPLSNPIIPAEDPYTHMALLREHVRDGNVDSLYKEGRLYPPGMHAYLAALWMYMGVELNDVVLYGPIFFGAIGLVGIAFLVHRSEGPVAGSIAALAFAFAPEAIFRTTMMAPTALDLALLPFLFYALMRVVQGELRWSPAAAALLLFLVFAHPWVIAIVALAGVVFAITLLAHPWPASKGLPATTLGLATTIALVGGSLAFSLTGCGGICGPGFEDVTTEGEQINQLAPAFAAAALLAAGLLALARRRLDPFLARPVPEGGNSKVRTAFAIGLALLLVLVTIPALQTGMPNFVDLPRMFGQPILWLAALGLVLLPFTASPAAHMGFALAASTYPFVIYNPFDSPFWSHRTAVYLGLGLVILAAVASAALVRAVAATFPARRPVRSGRAVPLTSAMAVMPVLLVGAGLGGALVVGTPGGYPGGWYRLFNECEHRELEQLAERVSPQPNAIVITGSWQSKLVLSALTDNAQRVWFSKDHYTAQKRQELEGWALPAHRPVYVVIDSYVMEEMPDADYTGFQSSPWRLVSECPGRLSVHVLLGGPR